MRPHMSAALLLIAAPLLPPTALAERHSVDLQLREQRYEMDISVDYETQRLRARVALTVVNTGERQADTIHLLLYRLLTVQQVRDDKLKALPFLQEVVAMEDVPRRQVNYVRIRLAAPVLPAESRTVTVDYSGYLLGYQETGWLYVQDRIDREFTILRKDCLAYPEVGVPVASVNETAGLPQFDYRARITVPAGLTVANGGELVARSEHDGVVTFEYRNLKAAWRMDFAISDYQVLETGPYRVFHFPEDAEGARRVMTALTRAVDLYTEWFGPLAGRFAFSVIEIPDGWGSQADVTSIIQTAGAFSDPRRHAELYHEVSHLWNVTPLDVSPRWNEGLASFLQYLTTDALEDQNDHEQAVDRYLDRIRQRSLEDRRFAETAMIDYGRQQITDLSYTVAMVMFGVIYRLVEQQEFNQIVGGFYRRFHSDGATTADFLDHANRVTSLDLSALFEEWVFTTRWHQLVMAGATLEDLASRYQRAELPAPREPEQGVLFDRSGKLRALSTDADSDC